MQLESEVFSSAEVAAALEANFVLVKLNVDDSPGTARIYGVSSIPADVIISPSGQLVSQLQSPPTVNQYIAQLTNAAKGYRDLTGQAPVTRTEPPQAAAQVVVTSPPPGIESGAPSQSVYQNDRYAESRRQLQTAERNAPANAAGAPTSNSPSAVQLAQGISAGPPSPGKPAETALHSQQLPAGAPPVGLDGFCPVTLVERRAWVRGNAAHGVVHRGRTYLFAGPEEAKKFFATPDRYGPVLSGNDPVLALDNRVAVPGRREFGVYMDNRVYLFASEESLRRFEKNRHRYAAEALQAMR